MKKLIFLFAFTFIGQQAFSQMYIVTLSSVSTFHPSGCNAPTGEDLCLTKTDPTGAQTYTCIPTYIHTTSTPLSILNQELNSIISQGYKLIETNNGYNSSGNLGNGLISNTSLQTGTTWYFAIP
jgi:hypothetical protein